MAKANRDSTTRRAVLAGIAAAPALGAPAPVAPALAAGADPIFAAIEQHRTALAAYTTATDDEQVGDAGSAHCDALANLLETKPTTVAGCAAVLRYVEGLVDDGHGGMFDDCGLFEGWYEPVSEPARRFLGTIAEALTRLR